MERAASSALSLPVRGGWTPRSGGRVGSGLKLEPDRLKHRVEFSIDFVIPESEHLVSELSQHAVAHCIASAVLVETMLIAVDLDNNVRATAFEIHDVVGNRRLAAEVMAKRTELA